MFNSIGAKSTTGRIYRAVTIFLAVIAVSTLGYVTLSDADPVTALYMTVITVASVGYKEAVVLDTGGRLFTIVVILAGLGSWTYLTITIIAFFVEGEFTRLFRERSIHKRIIKMRNHYIVCGLGQAGRSVLDEFMAVKAPCLTVEKNPEVVEEISRRYPELLAVIGDATNDEILESAGVERACGLVAATENDSDNMLIVLTARSKNKDLVITARATRMDNYDKMEMAGADHVIMPNMIGGMRMAATLLRPKVIDFLDVMMRGTGEVMRLEQIAVPPRSAIIGKTLEEAEIPKKTGMLVLAFKKESGDYTFNPKPGEQFQEGEVLIVLGPSGGMPALEKLMAGQL
jgi:voltage-gated potassium channel